MTTCDGVQCLNAREEVHVHVLAGDWRSMPVCASGHGEVDAVGMARFRLWFVDGCAKWPDA